MEKLIQLLQSVGEEAGALAWVVLGFLLPICIGVGLFALRWIRRGGLPPGKTQEFFVQQREIARWLRDVN
jgi:hypothetical protein